MSRSTVTLRCQRCDAKLSPARCLQVPQLIQRNCPSCDQDWSIRLSPSIQIVDDVNGVSQRGIVTTPYYKPVML